MFILSIKLVKFDNTLDFGFVKYVPFKFIYRISSHIFPRIRNRSHAYLIRSSFVCLRKIFYVREST